MGYSYDLQMSQIHALLAWFSVLIFLARGAAYQLNLAWAMDDRLRFMVLGVDLLMTVTGLSLWVLGHFNPLGADGWLGAKLLALIAYTVSAHLAMGLRQTEFRVPAYVAALLFLAYMMTASITRSAWLGLA